MFERKQRAHLSLEPGNGILLIVDGSKILCEQLFDGDQRMRRILHVFAQVDSAECA